MINVVLYDDNSIIRIAQRAVELFSDYGGFRTTKDTIWISGMYLKFAHRMLVLNIFDDSSFSDDEIIECLRKVLFGEEVYVSDNCQFQKYIEEVNTSTDFPIASYGDCS